MHVNLHLTVSKSRASALLLKYGTLVLPPTPIIHKVFFLELIFLPVVSEISGYREISEISLIIRMS
jgi:hypothetical protein